MLHRHALCGSGRLDEISSHTDGAQILFANLTI